MHIITYCFGTIILVLCILLVKFIRQSTVRVEENKQQERINQQLEENGRKLQQENQALEQEKKDVEIQLSGVKVAVQAQENILKSITTTTENLRQAATKQADEAYQARFDALAADYEKKENDYKVKYEQAVAILNRQLLTEKEKLEDLEAKQRAYIEAQKRAEEIRIRADYYRLCLTEYDVSDIKLLRDLQIRFARKDVIDKMIWEVYYKPAFDALTGKIFPVEKVCGIYKITCLVNKQAYIGQSVDIKERFRQHIKSGLSHSVTANKLYQEMYKQGPENFTFEILEQVPRDKLNERETYWIDFYKTKEVGFNATKGGA